jgi:hypothetical protein
MNKWVVGNADTRMLISADEWWVEASNNNAFFGKYAVEPRDREVVAIITPPYFVANQSVVEFF